MRQEIAIAKYAESDRAALKEITAVCFDGVSIDQNIETRFGLVGGWDWRWRKTRHIDDDVAANADGILVARVGERTVGYITTRIDVEATIGTIPNYAVLPEFQQQGVGRKLIEAALAYLKGEGMACIRIETLDQNEVGTSFYPRLGFELVATQHHYAMKT